MTLTKEQATEKVKRLNNYWRLDPCITINADSLMESAIDLIFFYMEINNIPIPPQPKNLDKLKNNIKVIVSNLYHAYSSDPERYIAYSRDSSKYTKTKGYKGFQFGYRNVIKVTDFLNSNHYIEHEMGHSASEEYKQAHLSRMRARSELIHIIEVSNHIKPEMIERDNSNDEVIIVKGVKPKKRWRVIIKDSEKKREKYQPKRKICKTPDNGKVREMRNNVQYINRLMEQTDITLDITDQELRELNARLSQDRNPHKQAIDFSRTTLHRVFLDRSLDKGGRFYGPWYQNIYKEYRPKIMINGAPVVEVDYSGYHPRILYGRKGLSVPKDPYTLDDYPDSDIMRGFLKPFLLMIINAKSPNAAMEGIRGENYKRVKKGKETIKPPEIASLSNNDLRPVMDKLIEKHKPIFEYLFKGSGDTLQWIDSEIAERIMIYFALKGYPCLPVHDSFIVDVRLGDELEKIMEKVFVHNFKKKIPVDDNLNKYVLTPEFISKHREEFENRITEGLADGTIDLDEFMEALREQKKRTKEIETFANELKRRLDSK